MKKILIGLILLLASAGGALLYLSPAALLAILEPVERLRAGLQEHELSTADLRLRYDEGGPQGAPTVLLVHGFGADKRSWLWFARPLTAHYRVIALELPGFGASSSPAGSYDAGTQAERLASFVEALGIRRPHLVGHAMGGQIAALYAARYPQQVASLTLIAPDGLQADTAQPDDDAPLLEALLVAPPQWPERVNAYLARRALQRHAHYQRILDHLRQRYVPLAAELPRIQAPVLLLRDEADHALDDASVAASLALLGNARQQALPGCGHAPMLDCPQRTAANYLRFIDALASPPASANDR